MTDGEILVPEVEGKTIRSMRIIVTGTSKEAEIAIDFTDSTSFSITTCSKIEVNAELYVGGTGEPEILKRYGDL
jgi:hypothetical protein